MKKINIPVRYLRVAPQRKTVAIRNPKTGTFKGRKAVQGKGDTTNSRYLIHDVDLNKDGKIDSNERGGTIRGRTVKVRASNRSSGYVRRI